MNILLWLCNVYVCLHAAQRRHRPNSGVCMRKRAAPIKICVNATAAVRKYIWKIESLMFI